jgi:magnesium transporter
VTCTISVYSTTACQPPTPAVGSALPSLLSSEGIVIWVDMTGPDPEDLKILREVFKFHPLAIEDTYNQRQRPKVEEYDDVLFGILNAIHYNNGEADFAEIDTFIGKNYLVTVHEGVTPVLEHMHHRADDACSRIPMSAGYLLYLLLDTVVDSYFPVLDSIGDEIDTIGDLIFQQPKAEALERLFKLKRTLSETWRVAGQQRDMFSVLMRENYPLIQDPALRYYLRDVYDHLLRISDHVNTFRDTLTNVVDMYMSSVSNRLNQQVNRLTIITMGIGLLGVLTGFYGMNFDITWPPHDAAWGVPFVFVMIVAIVFVTVYIARKR